MDMKDGLTLAGVVAGYLSFIRLVWGDIRDLRKKPRLVIEFDPVEDLREWDVLDGKRKQRVATVHVRNDRRNPALRCVAVLKPISVPHGVKIVEKEFVLHWADTDYTTRSNSAEPIEIGLERRRLDVAFTIRLEGQSAPIRGAWIGIPMALSAPVFANQAYLPPGEYRFKLAVECQSGKGDSKEFLVSSPETWTALSMRLAH
jgi:hypothetical protein